MNRKKYKEIMKMLKERNRTYVIKFTGNRAEKIAGFSIIMNSNKDLICSSKRNIFHHISKETIDLLNEAEIKFKIIE